MTKIDEKSWIPLGRTLAIVLAIAIGAWRVSEAFAQLKADIKASAIDRWTASDMQDFAYELRDQNRERGLVVPNPRQVRSERIAVEANR